MLDRGLYPRHRNRRIGRPLHRNESDQSRMGTATLGFRNASIILISGRRYVGLFPTKSGHRLSPLTDHRSRTSDNCFSPCHPLINDRLSYPLAGPFGCRRLDSQTMLRFHIPLFKPDVRLARMGLADKDSRFRPRPPALIPGTSMSKPLSSRIVRIDRGIVACKTKTGLPRRSFAKTGPQ